MEKIRTHIDENVTKEASRSIVVLLWVGLGVSLLTYGLYVLFGVIGGDWLGGSNITLLICGTVLLILILFLLLVYQGNLKKAKDYMRDIEYDLTDDAILFDVYRDNEKIENGKLYYKDFQNYRVTKSYILIKLLNNSILAIDKVDGLEEFLQSKGLRKNKK